jgi:hypothetical protein
MRAQAPESPAQAGGYGVNHAYRHVSPATAIFMGVGFLIGSGA